jgi:WD40-like Beta Propeller Repeat
MASDVVIRGTGPDRVGKRQRQLAKEVGVRRGQREGDRVRVADAVADADPQARAHHTDGARTPARADGAYDRTAPRIDLDDRGAGLVRHPDRRAGDRNADGPVADDAHRSRLKQVTRTDGFEAGARVSADGELVAVEHEDAAFATGGVHIARGRGPALADFRRLTASPALAMGGFDAPGDFSPDGSKLAFLRVPGTSAPAAASAIFVIGLDGHRLTQVTPYALNASIPRWSPDGSRLLFSSNWDNHSDRPDGTRLTQITHERDHRHAFTPDWAPDGTHIGYAFVAPGMDHTELHVRDLATGSVSVISRGAAGTHDQDPDWGPK